MPLAAEIYYHEANPDRETSEKPPVVLLHGAGGHHLYWPPEVRRLGGYRVLAPDLPGHGKSTGSGQQSIARYARQILDWLSNIQIHQAVFVGHSMGGAIALALSIQAPQQVCALGLISSGARLPIPEEVLSQVSSATTYAKALDAIHALSFGPENDERLVELARQRMTEVRQSVLQGDFLACNDFDMSIELMNRVKCPTLVVCGSEDRLTPLRFSQYLAANIAGARLSVIPQAGHMAIFEQPRRIADDLLEFLDTISYQPGK